MNVSSENRVSKFAFKLNVSSENPVFKACFQVQLVPLQIGFTHMRVGDGVNSLLQMAGLCAKLCKVVEAAKAGVVR